MSEIQSISMYAEFPGWKTLILKNLSLHFAGNNVTTQHILKSFLNINR